MQWPLRGFPATKIRCRPVAVLRNAAFTNFIRCINEDQLFALCGPACFQQQGRVKDDGVHIMWCLIELTSNLGTNSRTHNLIQRRECSDVFRTVSENPGCQFRPLNLPVWLQDLRSEFLYQLLSRFRLLQLLMSDAVSINDAQFELPNCSRNRRLSRPHPTNQTDKRSRLSD